MTAKDLMQNLLDTLLPNRAAPVLGRVIKAYKGPGKRKYAVDVRVVTAGTLEDTKQEIAEVPLSPIWVGQKGKGLYAMPSVDALVIIEYLHWNTAYPYVSGIWSDEYDAGEYKENQLVLTDGEGMNLIIDAEEKKITIDNGREAVITWEEGKIALDNGKVKAALNGDKLSVKNSSKSLFAVIDAALEHMASLAQNVAALKTAGSPALHVVSPDDIAKIIQDKTNLARDKSDLAAILEA